jgi:hypothetical protein
MAIYPNRILLFEETVLQIVEYLHAVVDRTFTIDRNNITKTEIERDDFCDGQSILSEPDPAA